MRRLFGVLPALAMLSFGVYGAHAAGASITPGPIRGVVPALRTHTGQPASRALGSGNLQYHGGPVMHANKVYAIYWVPSGYSVESGYESIINRFFQDVAAASGQTSNVYYTDTQYYDSSGSIKYEETWGGYLLDTNPFPANGCTDSYTKVCLSNGQITNEINRLVSSNGLSRSGAIFFMFTAKGVGSCLGSGECAFSQYCAYHGSFSSSAGVTYYANMPYADTVPSACDAGQHPNNNDADATINVTSHEQNETITDPRGNAWFDSAGYEIGDKCAWIFGTMLGNNGYGYYNQVINGHDYFMQQEWSNHSSACVSKGT